MLLKWLDDAEKTLNGGTVGGNMTPRRFPSANTKPGLPISTNEIAGCLEEGPHGC